MADKPDNGRRISPQGRAAQSAAGKANIDALIAARRAGGTVKQASVAFQAGLEAELGSDITASRRAAIMAATASFTALFIALRTLRAPNRWDKVAGVISDLNPLITALRRSMRDLGLSEPEPGGDRSEQPPGALAEYLAGKARKDGSDGAGEL